MTRPRKTKIRKVPDCQPEAVDSMRQESSHVAVLPGHQQIRLFSSFLGFLKS